ncbi:hypothetical protein ES708_25113 [subsurface metagenome]
MFCNEELPESLNAPGMFVSTPSYILSCPLFSGKRPMRTACSIRDHLVAVTFQEYLQHVEVLLFIVNNIFGFSSVVSVPWRNILFLWGTETPRYVILS